MRRGLVLLAARGHRLSDLPSAEAAASIARSTRSAGRASTSASCRGPLEADGAGYRASWEAVRPAWSAPCSRSSPTGAARAGARESVICPSRYNGRSQWRDGGSAGVSRSGPTDVPRRSRCRRTDLAEREPVPAELQVGPDPASLALTAIARAAPGFRLDRQSFDGRRAVAYDLSCAKADAGDGARLHVSGQLLAGASRAWRERRRARPSGSRWRVWLRRCTATGFWPVRLEAPTAFRDGRGAAVSIERRRRPPDRRPTVAEQRQVAAGDRRCGPPRGR